MCMYMCVDMYIVTTAIDTTIPSMVATAVIVIIIDYY